MNFLPGRRFESYFRLTTKLIMAGRSSRQGRRQDDREMVPGLHVIVVEDFTGMEALRALDRQ